MLQDHQIVGAEIYRMSDLQREILKVVCENENVDYSLIESKTRHDRIVILRSVHSLEEKKMIKRIKAEQNNPRSKLLFRPTDKGAFIAILHINVPYERCFSIYYKKPLAELNSLFKDEKFRENIVIGQIKYNVIKNKFDSEGKQKPLDQREDARIAFDAIMRISAGELNQYTIHDLDKKYGKPMMLKAKLFYEDIDKNVHQILDEFKKMGY